MKKTLPATIVLCALFSVNTGKAQTSFALNVNIGRQAGLQAANYYESQYYYFPEIDLFYDIVNRRFVYFENNRWVYASELPYTYRGYDVSRGYKVMINEYKPYLHGNEYREKYREYFDNYNHRAQSMSGNVPRGFVQDERARTEVNRDPERSGSFNGGNNNSSNNNPKDAEHAQQNNKAYNQNNSIKDGVTQTPAVNNANNHPEEIKDNNNIQHNETANNSNADKQSTEVPKDPPALPQNKNGVIQKNESNDDAQRSRFYSNGQANGVREAVRSPKFTIGNGQPKSAQDSIHNTQPTIGKDTLRNGGQIKGTSSQESNGTKSSQRNDHIVMTGHESGHGFAG